MKTHESFSKRNLAVQKLLSKNKVSALLVTDKTNIRYLSGFTGSAGFILLTKTKPILFTDSRYFEGAKYKVPKFFKLENITKLWKNPETLKEHWQKTLGKFRIKNLGFESDSISYRQFKKFKALSNKIKFVETTGIIEEVRSVKEPEEIKNIKKSQEINEKVLNKILEILKNAVKKNLPITEEEIAWKIRILGHEFGAEGVSFDPIVAFGKNSSIPHHESNKTKLKKRDIVLIDMGMKYQGYCSDMTRTIFLNPPTPEQKKVYDIVLQAQLNTIQQIKPNVVVQKIDTTCRDYIESKKHGKHFTHGTGHGVGLDIHELPSFHQEKNSQKTPKKSSNKKPATLKPGMIVTVEPGIYLKGKFGIRIEDMILVTEKGCQNLTKFQK